MYSAELPMQHLFTLLDQQAITYQRVDHPPVFTCEQASLWVPKLDGAETKNLFLRDGKGTRHFLLAVCPQRQVNLKALGELLGVKGLGFASAERLQRHLGLTPGSVSLLGLLNDIEHAVELLLDEDLWAAQALLCHPLINSSTLRISRDDLTRFFQQTGHPPRVIKLPQAPI